MHGGSAPAGRRGGGDESGIRRSRAIATVTSVLRRSEYADGMAPVPRRSFMTPRIVMPTVVLILAPFAFAADPPGSILGKNAAREAPKPKLVAKTSDALVHALPHDDDTWSQPVPGFRLLFTHLATGEM